MATVSNGLIKGQGLVLITGKKGAGKSHFATAQIKYIVDNFPDHPVYADIAGISIEGVEKSPDDWQTLLNEDSIANATVFYDEAQLLEWADNSNTKISSDSRIKNMTMIRHANLNIVVMTQDPTFVHSALRKLVDVHYHISHPFKDGKPKVFQFAGAMSTIDDKGAWKAHAVESFTHKLDKETSKLYKSVEDGASHDQKRKIPKRVLYMIGAVIAIILIGIPVGIWGIGKVYGFINSADERSSEMLNNTQDNAETITSGGNAASGFNDPSMVNPEQLTQAQLDELYKKYLDDYTVEVAAHDAIRPDSIMASNGKCMAYNMYGDGLNIPYDKCMDMLNNPETRPHKRAARQAMNNNTSASAQSQGGEQVQRDFVNNPPPPLPNNS
jgi:zona occludens toxin (predicted ATPase)